MATGAPGTNGVWLYGEDDSEATFSQLLNKAGTTVNTQLGLDRARLTALEAAGRIVQVKSTAKIDVFTTTSLSYTTVTGLSVSITPKFATSKILILTQVAYGLSNANSYGHFKVTRGGTNIYVGTAAGSRISDVFGGYTASDNNNAMHSGSMNYLDSPATTSPLTYQVEVRAGISGTVCVNRSGADTDNANHGRGASSITVLEVTA